MRNAERLGADGDLAVKAAQPALKAPKLYQVILVNDDYTTMDFVVEVLQRFFALSQSQATTVMLQVHTQGKGVCGVYTKEIAETKVAQVTYYSRDHQHPLLCVMEEA
jgi:ATP-dependent Clp protease adaptor protein ClpS